ncbi:MAG: cyclic nucleotide-binding domain-containing protein [Actinomycetota bacterium]
MEQRVTHSLVQMLRTIPDFSPLDEHSLLEIVGESMNLFWKAGGTIFEKGRAGEAFYVVVAGSVSIRDAEGHEVGRFESGDSFGEISLLLNTTHRREAVALTDCEILVLPREAFSSLLASNPSLAEHFQRVLKERVPESVSEPSGG